MLFLKFLKTLIVNNPAKSLMIIGFSICLFVLCHWTWETDKIRPISVTQDSGKYIYVYRSDQSNYNTHTEDRPAKIVNGEITYTSINVFAVLAGIGVAALGVILFIGTFIPMDSDENWDFVENWEDVHTESALKSVEMDLENNTYYYHIDDRLLGRSVGVKLEIYQIKNLLKEYYRAPNLFPEFMGTSQTIRDKKLKKILSPT